MAKWHAVANELKRVKWYAVANALKRVSKCVTVNEQRYKIKKDVLIYLLCSG